MPTILDQIVATKKGDLATAKAARPMAELQASVKDAPPVRDFYAALSSPGPIKLIAEVKKASPSQGIIRPDFDPVTIALEYERAGATCVSVLTDEPYFQGRLEYLTSVRAHVQVPVLRKDFIIDEYQIWEARAAGADAVLLIAECLDDRCLQSLLNRTIELGMTPLVEFYQPENCPRVLAAGARLIGVNNRDLRSFEVDLQHTVRMRARLPEQCTLVGESGIRCRADVEMLEAAGVNAILVGEQLMRQPEVGQAVRQLLGTNG